ncbi:MAG: hypothetical protein ACREF0_07615, partial [Acetobacteraceae bacterium]
MAPILPEPKGIPKACQWLSAGQGSAPRMVLAKAATTSFSKLLERDDRRWNHRKSESRDETTT